MNANAECNFKRRLLDLRKELTEEITHLSDTILTGTLRQGEHDGWVSESLDKELMLERNEENICQAVGDALDRLADGTFGWCIDCGRPISRRRLQALPYTAFCIECECRRERDSLTTSTITSGLPRSEESWRN